MLVPSELVPCTESYVEPGDGHSVFVRSHSTASSDAELPMGPSAASRRAFCASLESDPGLTSTVQTAGAVNELNVAPPLRETRPSTNELKVWVVGTVGGGKLLVQPRWTMLVMMMPGQFVQRTWFKFV